MPRNLDHIAVNDLLGKPPGWLLRSGITLVFLVFLLGLILAAFIHYPDKLSGQAVINYEQVPIAQGPLITGLLDTLLTPDGSMVIGKQLIGVLQSDASWKEITALDSILTLGSAQDSANDLQKFHHLGSLQATYSRWREANISYNHFLATDDLKKKQSTILKEVEKTNELVSITKSQLALVMRQIELETNDLDRHTNLIDDGVISINVHEEKEKQWLNIQTRRDNLKMILVQHEIKLSNLNQTYHDLKKVTTDRLFQLEQAQRQLSEELIGELQQWKENYLLVAPITGQLIYANNLTKKQILKAGSTYFSVLPLNAQKSSLIAKINIPVEGMGKIRSKSKIVIKLDAYPEKQFGTITTQIDRIALLSEVSSEGDNYYQVIAKLEQPLVTDYGKTLLFGIQMSGTATIITEDRSVLSRVFAQLLSLTKIN